MYIYKGSSKFVRDINEIVYRRRTYSCLGSKRKCHRWPTKRKRDCSNSWNDKTVKCEQNTEPNGIRFVFYTTNVLCVQGKSFLLRYAPHALPIIIRRRLVAHLHDAMHRGTVLNLHFIPFDPNVVHWVVHVYTTVFGTQPHGRFAFEVHRVHRVHPVWNAVVTTVFVVVLFAGRTVRVVNNTAGKRDGRVCYN